MESAGNEETCANQLAQGNLYAPPRASHGRHMMESAGNEETCAHHRAHAWQECDCTM